ncbi:GMC oxidoreductase-domain-containing protein, partial [Cantharellus anzutake]|uniref:GMC oxidoreductase-domain-containing protein n=1 Tax=Cantharellus anzutake TaxID=1750568 RepID=UPI00190836E8
MVTHIKSSLSAWASSQASNALSASALQKIYQIQANLIINNNAPVAEIFSDTGYPDKVGTVNWPLLPFSRGNVRITSNNPFVKPQTTVNWFAIDFDLSVQVAIGRFVRRLFQTLPLRRIFTWFAVVPDDAQHGSDAACHPIATCAMMDRALGGVVDGHLLVYDTKNVRVVDASVLPLQVSAHLSSTIYGIAEKAADIIKAAHDRQL